jgi:hypothetical protein
MNTNILILTFTILFLVNCNSFYLIMRKNRPYNLLKIKRDNIKYIKYHYFEDKKNKKNKNSLPNRKELVNTNNEETKIDYFIPISVKKDLFEYNKISYYFE